MLMLLSPAKKQSFEPQSYTIEPSQPKFQTQTGELVTVLQKISVSELGQLMHVSEKIAQLNHQRFASFDAKNYHLDNAKPAVFAFQGDAYRGLDANQLSSTELSFLQNHLCILSGLYGLLRPMDLIQPYRLEMKTALENPKGKNLYEFWGNQLTEALNRQIKAQQHSAVINLASQEYSKAIQHKALTAPFIQVDFKEQKAGKLKTIGIYAKRARGLMTRYAATQQSLPVENLKNFDLEGYAFDDTLSNETLWVFTRQQP